MTEQIDHTANLHRARERFVEDRRQLATDLAKPFKRGDEKKRELMPAGVAGRRFPRPWSVEETDACFIVRDSSGQALAYAYFEDEPGRRTAANLLTAYRHQYSETPGPIAPLCGTVMRGGPRSTSPRLPKLMRRSQGRAARRLV